MEKICWQITVAAFMQPLQYDLRSPAAKDTSITNAATARSNLDAAIYSAGTILQLQSTMERYITILRSNLDAAKHGRSERVLGFAKKTWGRDKFGLFQWSLEVKTCFWACLLFVKL